MKTPSYSAANPMSAAKLLAALAIASAALSATATTYRLKPDLAGDTAAINDFSSPSCWQIDGVDAVTYPQPGDTIEMGDYKIKNSRNERTHVGKIAVDNDYSISNFTYSYNKLHLYASEKEHASASLTITGALGGGSYQDYYIYDGVSFIAAAGSNISGALWDDRPTYCTLDSGSDAHFYGSIQSRHTVWTINSGATLTFAPSAYSNFTSDQVTQNAGDIFNVSGGNVYFPNGLSVTGGNAAYANAINQTSGSVSFGGNFTSAETGWAYTWSGGTLNITEDCAFGANIALTIPASSSVTLDVAEGKTFSAPSFDADSSATITKRNGNGIFAIAPTEATVTVAAGGIGFVTAAEYDLTKVSFGNNTKISLAALGATVNTYDSSLMENATFEASLSGVAAGTIVLNSNDSTLLSKAKTDLESSVPSGFALAVNGSALSIEAQSSYNFGGVGDILDASYWGGKMPGTSAEVAITGATTVATLSHDSLPQWNSIEVKDGATLCISTTATLPPIILNKQAKLEITNGAIVTLANISDLSGVATAQQLPILSIAAGTHLRVPGGMKFSNVNIDLKGQIAANSEGSMTFGYAPSGETTYIGLSVNGGEISLTHTSGDYDASPLEFCCPASGGSVVAVGTLSFKDATIKPWTRTSYPFTESYQHGFHMGINNPESNVFTVLFDNTSWGVSGKTIITGGAIFRLQNGGQYQNEENLELHGRTAEISKSAKVVIGNDSAFRLNAMGDYGNKPLNVTPASNNHQSIVMEEGGVFESYRTSGNSKGVLAVTGDSGYCVFMPSIYHVGSSATHDTTNVPFAGLASVDIASGKTLALTTRNSLWSDGKFSDNSGERVVRLADVPITGGGSVALSNDNVNVFGVIVTCGSNTATGTAGVIPPADGKGETTLYFANGANWAGTVTAGNFATTNLVDATAACTNSFGTLDLAAGSELKLRVRKTNGTIESHDGLNVGTYVNNGGRIVLEAMDESLMPGDTLVIGTIGEDSPMPAMAGHWRTERDANGYLRVKYSVGFSVIIR